MELSAAQIETLRNEYARINTVDPCGEAFRKIQYLLDNLSQPDLKMLAASNIKFISRLALNRVKHDA